MDKYDDTIGLRNEYLDILANYRYVDKSKEIIGDFFQDLYTKIDDFSGKYQDIRKSFLHEIFIYTVAFFAKYNDYDSLSYIVNKTYFGREYRMGQQDLGYKIFYFHNNIFNNAQNIKDQKSYYSGTAQHWIDNLAIDFCSKKEFIFGDNFLCNYAFFGANYNDNWPWFPITYVYDDEYRNATKDWAIRLKSKEIAEKWIKVFGFVDIQSFIDNAKGIISKINSRIINRPGFNSVFQKAPLISDYINVDEIGKYH